MVMIYRISLALLIVVLAIISTVNAFLSHGTGLVRFKAVDSTTRSFLSTSDDSNLQREDEIKGLKEDMKVLKIKREELLPSDPLYLAFTEEMTAIRNQVTALLTTQQVSSEARGGETKTIYVCLPSETKNGVPIILKHQWSSTDEMRKSVKNQGGGDLYRDVDSVTGVIDCVETYDDLVDGSTYFIVNGYSDAVLNSRTRAQVEDRVRRRYIQ